MKAELEEKERKMDGELARCELDAEGHCITCSDEAVPVTVVRVDQEAGVALVKVKSDDSLGLKPRASRSDPMAPSEPVFVCTHASGWSALDLRIEWHTNGWCVTAFTWRNDLRQNAQTVFDCQCATEHVQYSTKVQNMQEASPPVGGAPSIPTAEAEGLTTRFDKTEEVDITLVEHVAPGDTLLVHGGVAIAHLAQESEEVYEHEIR